MIGCLLQLIYFGSLLVLTGLCLIIASTFMGTKVLTLLLWITGSICGILLIHGLIEGVKSKFFSICWIAFAILVIFAFAEYHTFLVVPGFIIISAIAMIETSKKWGLL